MKPFHFLNIPDRVARDPRAPYVVLPCPYERTVSYGTGTAAGPAAILRASHEIEDFDEELLVPANLPVQTLPPLSFERRSEKQSLEHIRDAARRAMRKNRFLLTVGGEHSITVPLATTARRAFGPITVVQLDAHLDLKDTYRGTALSHACVMRRIRDAGIPTVHVGVRSWSRSEHRYVGANKVPLVTARDIRDNGDESWIERALADVGERVYLSFDIDALDPSLVPGTGTPEPGGLMWFETLAFLRRLFATRHVVAADIVEVAPVSGMQASEFIAARLGLKMLVYHRYRDRL